MILVLWFASVPARFQSENYAKVSPFNNLKKNIAGAYGAVKSGFVEIGQNLRFPLSDDWEVEEEPEE